MSTKRKAPMYRPSPEEKRQKKMAKYEATKELHKLLKDAVEENGPAPDIEKVRELVRHGAYVNYNSGKSIRRAVRLDRLDILQCLLDGGGDPNLHTPYLYSIFTVACLRGRVDSIRMLLDAGAIVPLKTAGDKPLHAVLGTTLRPNVEIIRLLLELGCDVNARDCQGWTPLHHLVNNMEFRHHNHSLPLFTQLFRTLVGAGADVDKGDYTRMTPLHHACLGTINEQVVSTLLTSGADPYLRDKKNATPIHNLLAGHDANVARRRSVYNVNTARKTKRIVELFISSGWSPNRENLPIHSLCHREFGEINYEVLLCLVNHGLFQGQGEQDQCLDKAGYTPLQAACMHKFHDMRIIRLLLDHGVDVHAEWKDGKSTLFLAADAHVETWNGKKIFFLESHVDRKEVVQVLIDHGAQVNGVDSDGWTALHHACHSGHLHTVQVLLEFGADATMVNSEGMTPFQVACISGHVPVMFFFLREHEAIGQFCW